MVTVIFLPILQNVTVRPAHFLIMDGQRQEKAFAGGSCRTFPQNKKGAYTTQWYKRLHLNSMDYMPDTAAIKTRHGIPEVFTYKS